MEQPTADITMASFSVMFVQKKIRALVLSVCQLYVQALDDQNVDGRTVYRYS
jgi:hypothetical protein